MSIAWGGIAFDGPYSLENHPPFPGSAIYVIMFKPDPAWRPDVYQVLYFGETGNIAERGFPWSHHAAPCWLQAAKSRSNVFVGFHFMPGSTSHQRQQVERMLTQQYQPVCNLA